MKKYQIFIFALAIIGLFPSIIMAATVKDAENYWENGQVSLAFQTLENILAKNPGDHYAYFIAGKYLMLRREYLQAINVYKQAVSIKPGLYDQQIRDMMIQRIKDELIQAGEVEKYPRVQAVRNADWIIKGLPDFVPINQMGTYTNKVSQVLIDKINIFPFLILTADDGTAEFSVRGRKRDTDKITNDA